MADIANKKKTGRKLKRSVRKTLGALFLASAIVVAAIPTDGLRAAETNSGVMPLADALKVTVESSRIPKVDISKAYNIYTTGDGAFQFAYLAVNDVSGVDRYAVILGYAGGKLDDSGTLTIPNEVDAYLKKSYTQGTAYGYCAVGKAGNFLYYSDRVEKLDEDGNVVTQPIYEKDEYGNVKKDEDGNPIQAKKLDANGEPVKDANGAYIFLTEPVFETVYKPCYSSDYNRWGDKGPEELYYDEGEVSSTHTASGTYHVTDSNHSDYQRIKDATVRYIGNQYLVAGTGNQEGTWTVGGDITKPEQGIFRGEKAGNILTLKVGDQLSGIGNYAFYGCTSLQGITLNNGLDTIGNYAFAECINMHSVDIKLNAMITVIGDHAFYNCNGLTSFNMPVAVQSIGDYAFAECDLLQTVSLCGGTMIDGDGKEVSLTSNLRTLGNNVFQNCPSLVGVEFPGNFAENNLPISMWKGCKALSYIKVNNVSVNFVGEPGDFKDFKGQVSEKFYFEGTVPSLLYTTAKKNSIAFKYMDEDIYEITIADENDPSREIVYQVRGDGKLIKSEIDPGIESVTIPATIGPAGIDTIWSNSFQNKCNLKKIVIPSSVRTIGDDAFRGCHNLQVVIFDGQVNVTSIGSNAFKTQDFTGSEHINKNCELSSKPQLMFVGPISYQCEPFRYAMRKESNINQDGQPLTYITYCSGWPTHLEVCYNPDTGKNELINYPTKKRIIVDREYTVDNYPYMTAEQPASMLSAMSHIGNADIPEGEQRVIDAVTKIVLPAGIESIKKDLFVENEKDEILDKTITAESLAKVEEGAFRGCTNLVGLTLSDATKEIGTYAFDGCNKLSAVTLPGTVDTMGRRPFKGCSMLTSVNFSGGPYFTCENGIIYELDSAGAKSGVVECLEGRSNPLVTGAELAGVKELYPEAFMNTSVVNVDLSRASVSEVPEYTFAYTPNLSAVTLPETVRLISANAFKNSRIQILTVPGQYQNINKDAFGDDIYDDPNDCHTAGGLTSMDGLPGKTILSLMQCEKGSMAEGFAKDNPALILEYTNELDIYYTVNFYDWNDNFLETQSVKKGEAAVPPTPPEIEGYTFIGWKPLNWASVTEDIPYCQAQYEKNDVVKHIVTFIDWNDQVYATREVEHGKDLDVLMPPNPVRAGYVFKGWKGNLSGIVKDETVYAYYESDSTKHVVSFVDPIGNTVLGTQNVDHGADVITPPDPVKEGYTFKGWIGTMTNIIRDETVYANFVSNDQAIPKHTVTFVDDDENNTVLYTQTVDDGRDAVIPQSPFKEGYTFKGWKGNLKNITRDETVYATYERNTGGNGTTPGDGTNPGGTTPGGTNSGAMYVLTVQNGSGSGNYQAGAQPIIIANDPASGQEFSHWTIDPAGTKLASAVLSASVVTMPEGNVTVTAHFKAKTGTSTGTGNSSTNNSNRPSGSAGVVSNGTTVVIDKNGLSNTGVVSATVKGSSDNFTIKITEDSAATEAVLRALMAEYGSDLSRIKYFPMDISLYDASGTRKITDTQGLLINITLPLPDSLIPYAGNNKVAGVVNDRLDRLGCKFTTIDGVSCVTFTAEHFSPYVIYVDTGNLIEGMVSDTTPKTGDGIHPKWFLSIGLACMSMVMFMQKDNKKKKVKVKVRA